MSTLIESEERKKSANKFEAHIKSFMEKLNFKDVNGAKDNFVIGGHQIDVCGGYDNALVIVECTMKKSMGKKSIREKINAFRGKISAIENACKDHPVYKKYSEFRYAMATKNIEIRHEDYELANVPKRITIWDENFIEYYEDLFDKIKQYAVFNLLGEMGIKPLQGKQISVPAFETKFGNIVMYNFLINPKELLMISYVARRATKSARFYQRIIIKNKLVDIADYVNHGEILPTNLILTFGEHISQYVRFVPVRRQEKFKVSDVAWPNLTYGLLTFPRDYRSCWIIDGQHRLYAFAHVNEKVSYYMPVVALKKLPLEKQCQIFLDINKNQKPVPADLVWDLNGDTIPNKEDGIISNSVKELNKLEPLKRKIYIPSFSGVKENTCPLKMAGMCSALKKAKLARSSTASETRNPFYDVNPDKTVQYLSRGLSKYFLFLKNKMTEDWYHNKKGFILDNYSNGVLIRLFEKIVSRSIRKNRCEPSDIEYEKYLSPFIKYIEDNYNSLVLLKKLKDSLTSEGARDRFLKEIIVLIRTKTGDKDFGGEIELPEYPTSDQIRELEGKLKEFLNKILSQKIGSDWLEKLSNKKIFKSALYKLQKNLMQTDPKMAYTQINFGECIEIIKTYKLHSYFREPYGFISNSLVEGALDWLSHYRSTLLMHDTKVSKQPTDDAQFMIYYNKIIKCLEAVLSG